MVIIIRNVPREILGVGSKAVEVGREGGRKIPYVKLGLGVGSVIADY